MAIGRYLTGGLVHGLGRWWSGRKLVMVMQNSSTPTPPPLFIGPFYDPGA
jgi:hypothetical protein